MAGLGLRVLEVLATMSEDSGSELVEGHFVRTIISELKPIPGRRQARRPPPLDKPPCGSAIPVEPDPRTLRRSQPERAPAATDFRPIRSLARPD